VLAFVLTLVPAQTAYAAHPPAAAHQAQIIVGPSGAQRSMAVSSNGLDREVFGYATSGSLGDPTIGYQSWNFDLLSTVAFFAIHVDPSGVLVADSNWTVWNSSTLTGLVSTAHAHGVKVVVTLRNPPDVCGALYNSDTTTLQIVKEVVAKGVDGVNIDYEGQLLTCPSLTPNQTDQQMLTTFAHRLRTALDNQRPGYYLSIATYSGSASGNDGFFDIGALNPYVDSFFVMAYDMDYANQGYPPLSCSRFCMAPVSPMTNYYWNDTNSMNQYIAVVGAAKTILGQPYYGRVACVGGPTEHATATGTVTPATYLEAAAAISSPDVQPGTYAIHRDANDPTGQDRWDTWYDNSLGCWREMYWSDPTTLAIRYSLVVQDNLRGVGFWTLNYGGGAGELWNTIQTYFVACTGATVTATPVSPTLSGTAVQLNATSSNCLNPLYQFWLLPPGGSWRIVQPYTSSAIYRWNTGGLPPVSYHFSIWVRDIRSPGPNGYPPNTYDTYTAIDYALTTVPCTGMTASASPATTAPAGTAITITGAATGCPNPLYQFWIQPPGGSWSIAQAYSSSATFNWSSVKQPAGSYHFSVWARDASSLGTAGSAPYTYDAFSGFPYALTVPNCATMTATPTPATPANVGTPVTINASAQGCPNPLFEFWLLPPGGTWTPAQSYSTNATFNWNTAGRASGAYRFSVWARDAGSPNSYDSFSAFPYTLATAPCTAMTATPAPASPTVRGTTVTVTGAATGCPSPLYEFWMLMPGGSWTLVQPYSPSAALTWNTTGWPAGVYRFSVWARDVSSSGTSGTAPYTYDTFGAFTYTVS